MIFNKDGFVITVAYGHIWSVDPPETTYRCTLFWRFLVGLLLWPVELLYMGLLWFVGKGIRQKEKVYLTLPQIWDIRITPLNGTFWALLILWVGYSILHELVTFGHSTRLIFMGGQPSVKLEDILVTPPIIFVVGSLFLSICALVILITGELYDMLKASWRRRRDRKKDSGVLHLLKGSLQDFRNRHCRQVEIR